MNPLVADEDNVVRQWSTVHREEHFKRLIECIGFCSYNLQLAGSKNLESSILKQVQHDGM